VSERNRRLARLYLDRFPHDESLVDEALSPDFVFHHLAEIVGPDAFRLFMRGVSDAFPDFAFTLHHLVSERDLVAAHYDFAGTQADVFLGTVPSRGRRFSTRGLSLFRCSGGRIAEIWVAFNSYAMFEQLGAVEPLGG
jgi:predicted ester cyclase